MGVDVIWSQLVEFDRAGVTLRWLAMNIFHVERGGVEASHRLPSGENITIHYQYNSVAGKAYDMKITTPQPLSPALQPGKTLE